MDLVPIWYHDRYWSKVFISTISTHNRDVEVEVTDFEFNFFFFFFFCFLFVFFFCFVKVSKTSIFPNLITDLIHLLYDDTYWSKSLPSSILTTLVHVKVKVTVMQKFSCKNFYVKVFRTSLLLNQMMDLIYIWYHDIYWSKVFISTISTHDSDLGVEVTHLEF